MNVFTEVCAESDEKTTSFISVCPVQREFLGSYPSLAQRLEAEGNC